MDFFLLDNGCALWYNDAVERERSCRRARRIIKLNNAGVAERATSVAKARMRSILATSELASEVADALDALSN